MQVPNQCIVALLRPLVRFCLRHSVRLQEVLELLKAAYVDVAEEELAGQKESSNISRISAMTGVHRRDVTRLLSEERTLKNSTNVVSRVLSLWQYDARFTTKNREPRVLSFEGKENEFVALVSAVSNDLNPYTILFELERTNSVERTEKGLRLSSKIGISEGDIEEGFQMLGADSNDLLSGVGENILNPQDIPNLHLKTEYDNIPKADIPQIREWFLREGSLFHERARSYLATFDRDFQYPASKGTGGVAQGTENTSERARVALGTFSFTEIFKDKKKLGEKRK